MNSLLVVAVVLARACCQDVIQHSLCQNYVANEDLSSVECISYTPIEMFCIPTEANSMESLTINLLYCSVERTDWIPTGLFQENNRIQRLHINAPITDDNYSIQRLKSDTFENLQGLVELSLEGFTRLRYLDPDVFRPLRNLRVLRLLGFGGQFLKYRQLGDALLGLSNSSLEEIEMDSIHLDANKEKVLNLNDLFRISGVNITSLVLTNNDFNEVTGTLSGVLPSLRYIECSMFWLLFSSMSFGLDPLIFLKHIEEVNFSFGRNWRWRRSLNRRRRDVYLDVLDPEIRNYYNSLTKSPNCFYGVQLKLSPSIKRAVVRNMDFFRTSSNVDICFDQNNDIEYFDFFNSPIGTIPGTFRGLRKMTFFNLQRTNMNSISYSLFHEMPNLEILLLGDNNIGESVAGDFEGSLFRYQNQSLRTLDLSGCQLRFIPQSMFSELSALQCLNLSRNFIETFQVNLHPCENLSLLNLGDNSIQMLSNEARDQLDSLHSSEDNRRRLTIDLSNNPLSCLCNATDFVVWLKSTKKVSFENFEDYTCLHPNGSWVSVNRLNVTELMITCRALLKLETVCPCSGLNYELLRQMSLSLTNVYCTYDGKNLSYADLVTNTNKTLQEYWWCREVITRENPFYTSPKFIVPVIIGFVLLVLLAIGLIVIYKKRYTPSDVARMMQCMDLRPYITHFIRYLSNHPAYSSDVYEFDVFVYFQTDDRPWVRRVLLEKLKHLKVITPDNFRMGAAMVDAVLDGSMKSRVVVLVLSLSFKGDDWCREVTLRSYTSHPGSVIPVVINNTDLSCFDDDNLFANLIATHAPIDLSSPNSFIWSEFISRVESIR